MVSMSIKTPRSSTGTFTIDCGVLAENGAAADVTADAQHLCEERPVDDRGVSANAVVGRDDHAGSGAAVLVDEQIDRPRSHERLVPRTIMAASADSGRYAGRLKDVLMPLAKSAFVTTRSALRSSRRTFPRISSACAPSTMTMSSIFDPRRCRARDRGSSCLRGGAPACTARNAWPDPRPGR